MSDSTPLPVSVILGDPNLPDRAKPEHCFTAEDLDAVVRMKAALAQLGEYRFVYLNNHRELLGALSASPPAFALNFCDNGYRNEARHELHVAAYLEMLGIPYSGSGPVALGLCYDKALVRALANSMQVPVPREILYLNDDDRPVEFVYPAFIKPNSADGSVGIREQSLVQNKEEAADYLAVLRAELPGQAVLIQEFLSGAEYSVALVGNPAGGFTVLPVLEVDYSGLAPGLPRILAYGSKVDPDSPYWTGVKYRQARIDEVRRKQLTAYASTLFKRLDLHDYGRFDFRADRNGELKLLEVNPNPAWCWDGKLNLMAGFAGRSYSDLLEMIIKAALARCLGR